MIKNFKKDSIGKKPIIVVAVLLIIMTAVFLTNPLTNTVVAETVTPEQLQRKPETIPTGEKKEAIFFDTKNNRIVVPKGDNIKSMSDIKQTDAYWDNTYQFSVDGQATGRTYTVNNSMISTIHTQSIDGKVILTVDTNQMIAFAVTEDEDHFYFTAKKPTEVYEHIVVVDPGHGGEDSGARYGDANEKDLTLALAKEIEEVANNTKDSGLKVYVTRQKDEKMSLEDRVAFANNLGGACLNLHYNMAPQVNSRSGTETFYSEKNSESKGLAEIMQSELVKDLQTMDGGIRMDSLYIITNVDAPSISLEIAYLNNENDLEKILSEGFRKKTAISILNAVRAYLNLEGSIVFPQLDS